MTDKFARLEELKQQLAETLKLPVTSDKVEEVAILKLLRESELERLVAGKHIDTRAFIDLTRTLSELTPAVMPEIKLEIVHGTRVECPSCHTEFNPHTDKPLPPASEASKSDPAGGDKPDSAAPPADQPRPTLTEMAQHDRATVMAEVRHGSNGPYVPMFGRKADIRSQH